MTVRAQIKSGYRWRLAIMALGLGFWTAYCLYDGLYAYPLDNVQYTALEAFKQEHPDWQAKWAAHASANALPTNPNSIKPRSAGDFYTQYIMAAITGPLALWAGIAWLRSGSRWVEADADRLRTSGGVDVPLSSVTKIDETRWKTKGIAHVYFDDAGRQGKVLLDDWKFERDATVEIYHQVKRALDPSYEPEKTAEVQTSDEPVAENTSA
jgi:hypothetical protein